MASPRLQLVLDTYRAEVEDAAREAEAELAELRARCRELEDLIARAQAAVGAAGPEPPRDGAGDSEAHGHAAATPGDSGTSEPISGSTGPRDPQVHAAVRAEGNGASERVMTLEDAAAVGEAEPVSRSDVMHDQTAPAPGAAPSGGNGTSERVDTVQEAMALVLEAYPDQGLTPEELVTEIEQRNLYYMGDGSPLRASQIHARVRHYADRFDKQGGRVFLRHEHHDEPVE